MMRLLLYCFLLVFLPLTSVWAKNPNIEGDMHNPNGYYYYRDHNGQYQCTSKRPTSNISYTTCNRVMAMPLGNYLASKQYGYYIYMSNSSILGINVEQINIAGDVK